MQPRNVLVAVPFMVVGGSASWHTGHGSIVLRFPFVNVIWTVAWAL